jgi:hypothetical protein
MNLDSSRRCIEFAIRRIDELKSEVSIFSKLNPFIEFVEHDANTGEQIFKVKLTKPMPHLLSAIAIEAIGHLRAALDQAGHSVALAAGKNGRKGHFPFGSTLDEALSCKNFKCKDIPQDIFDVMISYKPFKGGNDLLWGLNKLSNLYKHEIVVPLITFSSGLTVVKGSMSGPATLGLKWDQAKNEWEVARVGKGGKLDMKFEYTFCVAIGNIEIVHGRPATDFLENLAIEIPLILTAIETEAKRINIFQ